jgi:NAD-dependent dihydropyrimidine dehydrogenase PreA subunit
MSLEPGGIVRDVLKTAFRLVPWPTEPGLRRIGDPDAWSPVLVTGNYDLTVRRLERALRGLDVWLVVAPSGGINVWCAASGGHLGTHQVVTALKTSGIESCVRHRRAVLPQLAATGVRALEVSRRCGWRVRFGPVEAGDLPAYLAGGGEKTDAMRHVRFGPGARLEMACAWAAPISLVVGPVAALLRPAWTLPLLALVWGLAALAFLVFDRWPRPRLVLAGLGAGAALATVLATGGGGGALLAALLASLGVLALVTFDLEGSSPTAVPRTFDTHDWRIALDLERCQGVYTCWAVCPEACFEKREDVRKVELAHDDRCIRCGACVVQCPMDALSFTDGAGRRVEPEVIRRFKLNLLGRRAVEPRSGQEAGPARGSTDTAKASAAKRRTRG